MSMAESLIASHSPRQAEDGFERVACILCGSAGHQPVLAAPNWDPDGDPAVRYQVVRCEQCGLQFLNPRPTADRLASFYPEHYYAYQHKGPVVLSAFRQFRERLELWPKRALRRAFWGYPPQAGRVARWWLRLLLWPLWLRLVLLGKDQKVLPYRGRGRLLEIGCGTGSGLDYQRRYGFTATGVEPNPSAAAAARANYGVEARTGTLEGAAFPARSFDLIVMSHVFEHLPAPDAALEEMRRVLDDGGLVVIKLPNVASASARRFGPYWLGWDLPRHLYHFEPSTVTALLRRHGFVVERIRQDVGSWSFWRESRRFQARHEQGRELPDAWWRARRDQLAEGLACLRGQGSVLVVYARHASPTPS